MIECPEDIEVSEQEIPVTLSNDLDRYLVTGKIDILFLRHFDRFCRWAHKKYQVIVSFEEYRDLCLDKTVDALPDYDPSKGKFKSYVHNFLRNTATKVNSKLWRIDHPDDLEKFSKDTQAFDGIQYKNKIENFQAMVEKRGLVFDKKLFMDDLTGRCVLPSTKVFLWASFKGMV